MMLGLVILLWISVVFAENLNFCAYHRDNLRRSLSLGSPGPDNLLLPFNGTRIPGSQKSIDIQIFIKEFFGEKLSNDWSLEVDSFEEKGYNFTNLVFTPFNGDTFLVLAAHYDTKIEPKGFIGATDSGASCAILLYVAKFLDQILTSDRDLLNPWLLGSNVGLKIVFFDGEEALEYWTAEDSIYGSKHLAEKWKNQGLLDRIDLFVLLDLLGSQEQLPVHSYHRSSHAYYEVLSDIERVIAKGRDRSLNPSELQYLMNGPFLDDDHRPFYEAGVSVLHLIPFPFPSVWHKLEDNFENLDETKIQRWAVMMSEFVVKFVNS